MQDADEPGIGGATLTLLDASTGAPVTIGANGESISSTTVSDASGHYAFTDLAAGSYQVKIDLPATPPSETITVIVTSRDLGRLEAQILDASNNVVESLLPAQPWSIKTASRTELGTGYSVRLLNGTTDVTAAALASGALQTTIERDVTPWGLTPYNNEENFGVDSSFGIEGSFLSSVVTLTPGTSSLKVDAGIAFPRYDAVAI